MNHHQACNSPLLHRARSTLHHREATTKKRFLLDCRLRQSVLLIVTEHLAMFQSRLLQGLSRPLVRGYSNASSGPAFRVTTLPNGFRVATVHLLSLLFLRRPSSFSLSRRSPLSDSLSLTICLQLLPSSCPSHPIGRWLWRNFHRWCLD